MPIAFLIFLPLLLTFVVAANYVERKIAAFTQDRLGPYEVGPKGLLQPIADLLKLLQKEDIAPLAADKKIYLLAPIIIFTAIFAGFAVVPLTPNTVGSGVQVGVFYILAITSMDVIGILMAGWGSNNKYSLYGAVRSVAQIVSYEIPLGLSVLCVVMICQSLDLQEISFQQGIFSEEKTTYLFGLKSLGIDVGNSKSFINGGFLTWNIVRMPFLIVALAVFFVASLAEANRTPFDIPEAEAELVAGYHTEYSGFRWAMLMLGEYGMMLLVSFLAAILFLGSWNTPLPNIGSFELANYTSGDPNDLSGTIWGAFWLVSKAAIFVFFQMLARWTYPRLRVDQLMNLCWKYLTPIILVVLLLCGIWRLLMV